MNRYVSSIYFHPIWILIRESKIAKWKLSLVFFISILETVFESFFLWVLAPFTDSLINKNQDLTAYFGEYYSSIFNTTIKLALLLVISLLAKSSLQAFKTYSVSRINLTIRAILRLRILESFLDSSWKLKLKAGSIMDAYVNASATASKTILHASDVFTNCLYVLGAFIVVIAQFSFGSVVVLGAVSLLYLWFIYFLRKYAKKLGALNHQYWQTISQRVTEAIRGKREIQIYGTQSLTLARIKDQEFKFQLNRSFSTLLNSLPTLLPSIFITLIVLFGLFVGDDTTLSNAPLVITSLVIAQRAGGYLATIGTKLTTIRLGSEQISYVLGLLNTINYSDNKATYSGDLIIQDNIFLKNISFRYDNSMPLLVDTNMTLTQGRVTIIVGPSGSGKSTIFSLLLKECSPNQGQIDIGNISLERISRGAWYKTLSLVPQEPYIFDASIFENIKMGNNSATKDQVLEAAECSGAIEFINKLPGTLDFSVFEGGKNLSGGQCQLISLTRAALRDPSIIFLDEPSNNLDDTGVSRLKALLNYWASRNKIILVSTHDQRLLDSNYTTYQIDKHKLIEIE